MSTLISRNFSIELSDEARRRAREYLISTGIRVEALKPIVWPEDAVSAHREHMYAPWQFTTKSDIRRGKRERMDHNLWWKREYGVTHRRPLYVWVFWCPGISGIFEGLWTYIVGVGREYHGGGYKGELAGHLLEEVMRLYPVCDSLFPLSKNQWQKAFVEKYTRGKHCGRPQGKAPIWAEVQGTIIRKILGCAQWPRR